MNKRSGKKTRKKFVRRGNDELLDAQKLASALVRAAVLGIRPHGCALPLNFKLRLTGLLKDLRIEI
jgi:hypothetical protein